MAGENTNSTGEFTKKVYGEKLEKLPWELGLVTKAIPFKADKKLGTSYEKAIVLTHEHGRTYNGTSGAVATLAAAIASVTKQASITAYEYFEKARIAHRLMHDALSKGEAAFEDATSQVLENLQISSEFTLEHQMMYGQKGLFQVESITSGVITVTAATWSAALAAFLENAIIEVFSTQAASATQRNGDMTVTAVDFDNKTVTVTGTSSGVQANDWAYLKGARTTTAHSEFLGITGIMANTGSLFGITASTYNRWRGNTKTSCGTATMAMYLSGLSKIANRGIRVKKTGLYVPTVQFERLNADLSAARNFDGSWSKKGANGFEFIEFHGSTGLTEIIPHPLVRDGDAFAFTDKNGQRVGSKDLGWALPPGGSSADIWKDIDADAAYEARVSYIQAPFFNRPAETIYYTGITTT